VTLDTTALRTLAGRVATVIAPPEAVAALGELGFTTVTAVATGSSATLGPLTVHATADGGYVVVQDATRVFVAADPADVAATTAEVARFAPLTVALLPIGGRRLLGLRRGLDPEGAAAWAAQLDANRTIPYRYGLAGGAPLYSYASNPSDRFRRALRGKLPADRIVVLAPGDGWHHTRSPEVPAVPSETRTSPTR
jgi:L-ascorbate metabolism protein UlaG (beta-lactamase superfamily)